MTNFFRTTGLTAGLVTLLFASTTVYAAEKTITLTVDGMTCASCPYMVKKSLTKVDGVKAVDVSLQTRLAVVTFDDAKTTIEAMTNATFEAGFPSEPKIAGMNVPSSAPAPSGTDAAAKAMPPRKF